MTGETTPEVYSRLGKLESSVGHLDDRLDRIEDKLDRTLNVASDVSHMKRNIAMMREPVEDYKRVKERGTGMKVLAMFIVGAVSSLGAFGSWAFRTFLMGW